MMELKYYNFPGRAGAIRILLTASDKEWKDTTFRFDEWPAIKPTTPLGCIPTLEIDGTVFCQSNALMRYAAKMVGMCPDDPLQALIVDEVCDTINELWALLPYEGTDDEKKISRPAFQKNVMTKFFGLIEKRIQQFGGSTKDTVCGVPSFADLSLMTTVDGFQSGMIDYIDTDFFKDYPGILACYEKTANLEMVKSYNASKK